MAVRTKFVKNAGYLDQAGWVGSGGTSRAGSSHCLVPTPNTLDVRISLTPAFHT